MNHRCWRLSADDLTSLWDECPRCFYRKHVHGISRPPYLVPAAFHDLDAPVKPRYWPLHTAEASAATSLSGAWRGVVAFEERWVRSDPLVLPGRESTLVLQGRFDTAVRFDDDTFGLLAFTTRAAGTEEAIERHARRLHACALAAEYAAPRGLALGKVSRLGLLVFASSAPTEASAGSLDGAPRWIDIPRDAAAFLQFLDQVVAALEQPAPPAPSSTCGFCADLAVGQLVERRERLPSGTPTPASAIQTSALLPRRNSRLALPVASAPVRSEP